MVPSGPTDLAGTPWHAHEFFGVHRPRWDCHIPKKRPWSWPAGEECTNKNRSRNQKKRKCERACFEPTPSRKICHFPTPGTYPWLMYEHLVMYALFRVSSFIIRSYGKTDGTLTGPGIELILCRSCFKVFNTWFVCLANRRMNVTNIGGKSFGVLVHMYRYGPNQYLRNYRADLAEIFMKPSPA